MEGAVDGLLRELPGWLGLRALFVVYLEHSWQLICQAMDEDGGRVTEIGAPSNGRCNLDHGGFTPKVAEELLRVRYPFKSNSFNLELTLEIINKVSRRNVGEDPPFFSVLVEHVYEILMAEYSSALIVKRGLDPLLSFSNAASSRNSAVVYHTL
jgi:hypothetical protein